MVNYHVCRKTINSDILKKYIHFSVSVDYEEDLFRENKDWTQYYLIVNLSDDDIVYLKLTDEYLYGNIREHQLSSNIREKTNAKLSFVQKIYPR